MLSIAGPFIVSGGAADEAAAADTDAGTGAETTADTDTDAAPATGGTTTDMPTTGAGPQVPATFRKAF